MSTFSSAKANKPPMFKALVSLMEEPADVRARIAHQLRAMVDEIGYGADPMRCEGALWCADLIEYGRTQPQGIA